MSLLICLRLVCSWLGRIGTSTIWSLQISNPQRNRSLKVTSAHVCSTFRAVKKCDRCRSNNPQEMLVDCPTWHFSIGVMVKCWSIAQLGIFPKHPNIKMSCCSILEETGVLIKLGPPKLGPGKNMSKLQTCLVDAACMSACSTIIFSKQCCATPIPQNFAGEGRGVLFKLQVHQFDP